MEYHKQSQNRMSYSPMVKFCKEIKTRMSMKKFATAFAPPRNHIYMYWLGQNTSTSSTAVEIYRNCGGFRTGKIRIYFITTFQPDSDFDLVSHTTYVCNFNFMVKAIA